MRLDLSLCVMWDCEALVGLLVGVLLCRVLMLPRAYCVICTMYAAACSIRVVVYTPTRIEQAPLSHNAALSRRRSENKPPHDYKAIPVENNPPPQQIELLSGLYSCILYYYLYLFCFIVFYLTPVLIWFVKLCICRDLYTTRARMHIASSLVP